MDECLRILLLMSGVFFACLGAYYHLLDKNNAGTSTYGMAAIFLALAFIDKIKKVSAFGVSVEAKTQEEIMRDVQRDLEAEGEPANFAADNSGRDGLSDLLSLEKKVTQKIARSKYPQGKLSLHQKVRLGNRDISADGFVRLGSADVFIEVKVSRRAVPPVGFLRDSLAQYISRIQEYSELASRSAFLEFVVLSREKLAAEEEEGIRARLRETVAESSIPVFLSFVPASELRDTADR